MNSIINYDPAPIIDAAEAQTNTSIHDATRVDLKNTPWRMAKALIITAKTTNDNAPSVAISVNYAFSHEAIDPALAVNQLGPRTATLNVNVGETGGGILNYATAPVTITGRYLYVWWTAAANDNGDMAMEIHAIPAP